jgi:SAM-dependent methyltransferase
MKRNRRSAATSGDIELQHGSMAGSHLYVRRELDDIAARWDTKATTWDTELLDPACHLNEDEGYERFLGHVRQVVQDRRDFCSRHGVIDAGCGTGLVLAQFKSAFTWGLGVDISALMIRTARKKHLSGVRFIVGDCFCLPAICAKAGAVLSRGVLLSHYGPRQGEALLRAACMSLVPNGFVVFDFLNAPARLNFAHKTHHKTWFTADEVREIAKRAGFSKAAILGQPQRRVRVLLAERS